MNFQPLISIITPSYNAVQYISQTYDSINKQTYKNWEWLITDDCSSDATFDFISAIAIKDKRVKVFKNTINSGAAISRNNSIKNADGKFLAFIDSDDLWHPSKLNEQYNFMIKKNIDFSFTSYELIDNKSESLNKKVDVHAVDFVDYEDMLKKKVTLGCSTVMLRKSAFCDISMPLIRTGQDYALWLKLLKNHVKAYKINKVLTQYRITPNSISRNKIKKARRQWEIYRKLECLSISKSIQCFSYYSYRAIFRK